MKKVILLDCVRFTNDLHAYHNLDNFQIIKITGHLPCKFNWFSYMSLLYKGVPIKGHYLNDGK